MKIVDWISGKRLNLETSDIEERDDVVTIPAWQFALFVHEYEECRKSMILYLFVLLCVIGLFVFLPLL